MSKWEKVRLGDIGAIVTGNTPSTKNNEYFCSDDIPFYKPNDIDENGITELHTPTQYIAEAARTKSRILPPDSVLVTCIGIIGKVGITTTECACNQQINAIIPKRSICNYKYLAYSILRIKRDLQAKANAPIVPIINKSNFSETIIPLPPLNEQHRIAQTLDAAAELLRLRKQQLAELDTLVKSRFIEMFGDPVTNPMGWGCMLLSKMGELNRGVSKHRPRNDPALLGGPYPLIQTGDISNAGIYLHNYSTTYSEEGLKQSKIWPAGTLCITIAANIAKTAILGFDACFPDSVVSFQPNKFTNTIFMHYWFSFFQSLLESQAPESAQKNINLRILNDLNVIAPPLSLQTQFAGFVQKVEASKALVQQSIDETQALFDSLMCEYFE